MTKRDNDSYEYSLFLLKKCNNEKLIMLALSRILSVLDQRDIECKGLIRALDLKSGIAT
jgi:hypothetical protein